jgi:hypothetical protein
LRHLDPQKKRFEAFRQSVPMMWSGNADVGGADDDFVRKFCVYVSARPVGKEESKYVGESG